VAVFAQMGKLLRLTSPKCPIDKKKKKEVIWVLGYILKYELYLLFNKKKLLCFI